MPLSRLPLLHLPPFVALLCLAMLGAPLPAAAPPTVPSTAEVGRLIEQLGDDDFDTRERADARLRAIGEPALDALHGALSSRDLEVRRRARRIVDAVEGKLYVEQLRLTGHKGEVWRAVPSADGKRVLTSSADKTLCLWDTNSGECLRVFEGHTGRVVGAALSPDGKRVLSGSDDRTVRLWDAASGKELDRLTGHMDSVFSVAFGPEGQALSGGLDKAMLRWDLKAGRNLGVHLGHAGHIRAISYSPKARVAAVSSSDQVIRLWDLEAGKVVRTLSGHTGNSEFNVCFSADGKRVVSSHQLDHTVRIWDVETGKELKRFAVAHAYGVGISPDGKRLVTGGNSDRTVRVLDAETGKELRKYEGHTKGVHDVAFFPDGKRIISASADGTARV